MKEVVVTTPVWTLNGVNIFAAALVRGLRSRGWPSRLLVTGVTHRDRKAMPLPRDIPVDYLDIPFRATWKARRNRLAEYLEARAPCIYLPNHDILHSSIAASLPPQVGVVGIVHSDDAQHYEHVRRMGGSWNSVVAVSRTIAGRIESENIVDQSRVTTIPYGVPVAAELPPRDPKRPVGLVYAGRLDAVQKRVGDLVEIAESLTRLGVQFELTIIGEGPERNRLNGAIIDAGLSSRVRLHRSVTNGELSGLYSRFDAFVLTSEYEGMPIGLLEAMGQGCVPFTTRIESGIPDLITHGENGFTAPVGDVNEFAKLIKDFASSPSERTRLGLAAWRTVKDGPYTLDKMVASYIQVFERVSTEMDGRSFQRTSSRSSPPISLRDRIAAPLWAFRPAMRAQQKLAN